MMPSHVSHVSVRARHVKHFLQRVDAKSSSFYKSLLYGETVVQDDMDLTDLVKAVDFTEGDFFEKNVVLTLVTIPYVRGSEQQLLSYSRRGHVTKVQEVYESAEAGFPQDPDVTDGLGRTPLYMAASRGHWEIVRLLCDKSFSACWLVIITSYHIHVSCFSMSGNWNA